MVLRLLESLGWLLLVVLLITFVAAVLLGIGTLLTWLFAVSVWEATVVVMAVAAGAWWVLPKADPPLYLDDIAEELTEEDWEPRTSVADFVIRPNRRRRRRKR